MFRVKARSFDTGVARKAINKKTSFAYAKKCNAKVFTDRCRRPLVIESSFGARRIFVPGIVSFLELRRASVRRRNIKGAISKIGKNERLVLKDIKRCSF